MKIQKPTISQWESSSANQEMNIANLESKLERLNSNLLSTKAISNGWEDKYNETLVELKRVREAVKNQRERIVYLEGATNHAVGTPLTIALDRAEKAEAGRDELKAKIHDLCSDKYCPDACKIKAENAQLKEDLDRLSGINKERTDESDKDRQASEQARTEAINKCLEIANQYLYELDTSSSYNTGKVNVLQDVVYDIEQHFKAKED